MRNVATAERLALFKEKGDSLMPITRPANVQIESDEDYLREVRFSSRLPRRLVLLLAGLAD